MTTTNHWGRWVDSEEVIPGIINGNNILWEYMDDGVCLTCEEIYSDIENPTCPECGSNNVEECDERIDEVIYKCEDCENEFEYDPEYEKEFVQCDSDHERLYGDWIEVTGPTLEKEKEKCYFIVNGIGYYPDTENGDFAAKTCGDNDIRIYWSKTTKRCNLCSPCAPGQADLNSSGKFLAYDLPKELKYVRENEE